MKQVETMYVTDDAALAEYKAMWDLMLESQRQRVTMLTASLGLIGVLFAYLAKDGTFPLYEAFPLLVLTFPVTLYAYSTRVREAKVASFMAVFLAGYSFWAAHSPSEKKGISLGFFERGSNAMIVGVIALDVSLLGISYELSPDAFVRHLALLSAVVVLCNVFILARNARLSNNFEENWRAVYARISSESLTAQSGSSQLPECVADIAAASEPCNILPISSDCVAPNQAAERDVP